MLCVKQCFRMETLSNSVLTDQEINKPPKPTNAKRVVHFWEHSRLTETELAVSAEGIRSGDLGDFLFCMNRSSLPD